MRWSGSRIAFTISTHTTPAVAPADVYLGISCEDPPDASRVVVALLMMAETCEGFPGWGSPDEPEADPDVGFRCAAD